MNILKAKEHTIDIFRNMKKTADAWRLIAFGLLAANIALAAGFAAVASQNRVVPYIVQVDEHGYEIAVKPAEELPQIDERIIIARVGTFVERLRTVVSDSDAQKNYMRWVYASIPEGSQALAATNAFYKDNDPFKEAAATSDTSPRTIEDLTVLIIMEIFSYTYNINVVRLKTLCKDKHIVHILLKNLNNKLKTLNVCTYLLYDYNLSISRPAPEHHPGNSGVEDYKY